MFTGNISDHAAVRLAQRAIHTRDVELAMLIGTEVEDGVLVLERDSAAIALKLARLAERVRRLAGLRVVQTELTTITVYRASRRKQRGLLRRAEGRNLED